MKKRKPLFRNRGRTQHKLSKFLGENSNEKIAVDKLLKFTSKHYVTISRTVEEYEIGELSKRRVIIASVYRFCSLVTLLRYLLPSIFHTETMISIMSDPNYLLSKRRILSMCVSTAGFVIFSYGMLVQVNEVKHKWHLLTFLYDWKHCRLMALNAKHKKKLGISINLMFKFFYQQFWPLVLFTQVVFSGATIVDGLLWLNKYDFYVRSVVRYPWYSSTPVSAYFVLICTALRWVPVSPGVCHSSILSTSFVRSVIRSRALSNWVTCRQSYDTRFSRNTYISITHYQNRS